ncbi:MAG: ATP-binding protein [bacterium]
MKKQAHTKELNPKRPAHKTHSSLSTIYYLLSTKHSIVLRFSLVASALVLITAVLVYIGMEYRYSRLHRTEGEERVRLLTSTIAHGIKNLITSPVAHDQIPQVVDTVLARSFSGGEIITLCRIQDRQGNEVYSFAGRDLRIAPKEGGVRRPRPTAPEYTKSEKTIKTDVFSGREKVGSIEIRFILRSIFEAEKMRQIITIGNTLSTMIRSYLLRLEYFQINDLVQKITEEDKNILYCSVIGENGENIFTYRTGEYRELLTETVERRSMSVGAAQPVVVQSLDRGGEIVEAAFAVEHEGAKLCTVRIGYSIKNLRASITRERRIMGTLILFFTLLSLALAVAVARSIARPIAALSNAVRTASVKTIESELDFARAEQEMENISINFAQAAAILKDRTDEIGELTDSFADLLNMLAKRFRELKHLYHKMSQADRLSALGQLSAGIAHEINNPLTIISTYIQMMKRRTGLDEEFKEEIKIVYEEIQRIAGKIKDLLSFAQETPAKFEATDLHQFIRDALLLTRHSIKKNRVELVEDFTAGDGLEVSLDRNRMRQVFLNLILNAIQAMEGGGGTLTVKTQRSENEGNVRISITDTGCGISSENISRIFDPFFTTKGDAEGTGLGLAISYRIVQAHGGEITVDSALGAGSTFTVILPL